MFAFGSIWFGIAVRCYHAPFRPRTAKMSHPHPHATNPLPNHPELMYHIPHDERTQHIPEHPRHPVPSPTLPSVRPERSGAVNTTSKPPSAEVVLTAPRSRRARSLHTPVPATEARIPLAKAPPKTPSKMSHCDISPATKMSQMSHFPKSVTFFVSEKCHTLPVSGPASKMSQMTHCSATKTRF